jgi:hypothetical protein
MNPDEDDKKEISATETSLSPSSPDEQRYMPMMGFFHCLKPVVWLRDFGDRGPTPPKADKTDT